jgi:hypothetical protein
MTIINAKDILIPGKNMRKGKETCFFSFGKLEARLLMNFSI